MHRSAFLTDEDVMLVDGIPTTRVSRTLFDLGALISATRLRRIVLDALNDRQVTEQQLHDELRLARRGRPGSAAFRRALDGLQLAVPLTESWLEDRAVELITSAGFDSPERQVNVTKDGVFLGRLDLAYPEVGIGIEVDGYEFHSTALDFVRDRQRQNDLIACGWQILRFTYEDSKHPRHFLRCLELALEARS
jgi:hypothetical protein